MAQKQLITGQHKINPVCYYHTSTANAIVISIIYCDTDSVSLNSDINNQTTVQF